MTSPFLVTGGTGTLGRLVVPRLRHAGCDVRVLSRHSHPAGEGIEHVLGDLATGEGVDTAVKDVEIVVHLAGSAKGDDAKARHLVQAAVDASVQHLVFISVVGADRVPVGYFQAKQAAERIVADSGVAWTILRATQFHDLIFTVAQKLAKLPVVPVPKVRFQPVDAAEVAHRLVELTLGQPAGLVDDFAGPQIATMKELLDDYLRVSRKHRLLVPVRVPGKAGRAFRAGANLSPDRDVGRRTWEQFLTEQLQSRRPAAAEVEVVR